MLRNNPSQLSRYFRKAAADLLGVCDGLDSPLRFRSGGHLLPARVRNAVDRVADLGARLGPGDLPARRRRDLGPLKALAEHPLFIGGVHKSGTNLLSNLCDGHESLVVLPCDGGFDLAFLRRISACSFRERRRRLYKRMIEKATGRMTGSLRWLCEEDGRGGLPAEDLARWTHYFSRSFDAGPGGLLRVVAASFAAVVLERLPGKRVYWAHKATLNIPAAPELLALFPAARFIEMQRDSRGVYASQRRKTGVKERPFRPYYELLCLHKWKRASERNRKLMGEGRYRIIRYEDLVSDCGTVMDGVARFLEIPPGPVPCEPGVTGEPAKSNSAFGEWHGKAGTVSARSFAAWREVLDPEEIAMLEHFASAPPNGIAGKVTDPVVTVRHLVKIQKLYLGEERVRRLSPAQFLNVLAMRRRGTVF